jgi:hypothetical protein
VPTILTTVGARGSILVDPLFKELSDIFPDVTPIDRTSTHAWSHPEVRAAVDATGRRKLIMAGLVTEVCLAQSVLAALKDGFDVYFVSDCSGGITVEAHEDAKARMVQAGARPMSWQAVTSEWAPDYTSPERQATTDIQRQRGGVAALMADYVFAQVTAGLVKAPDSGSVRATVGAR